MKTDKLSTSERCTGIWREPPNLKTNLVATPGIEIKGEISCCDFFFSHKVQTVRHGINTSIMPVTHDTVRTTTAKVDVAVFIDIQSIMNVCGPVWVSQWMSGFLYSRSPSHCVWLACNGYLGYYRCMTRFGYMDRYGCLSHIGLVQYGYMKHHRMSVDVWSTMDIWALDIGTSKETYCYIHLAQREHWRVDWHECQALYECPVYNGCLAWNGILSLLYRLDVHFTKDIESSVNERPAIDF